LLILFPLPPFRGYCLLVHDLHAASHEGRHRHSRRGRVLTAPKKPPTLLRIKSFRAPVGDPNSDAARIDRMATELACIDVFAQQVVCTAQEWARAADVVALALLA
jgi:hypothetical protein